MNFAKVLYSSLLLLPLLLRASTAPSGTEVFITAHEESAADTDTRLFSHPQTSSLQSRDEKSELCCVYSTACEVLCTNADPVLRQKRDFHPEAADDHFAF